MKLYTKRGDEGETDLFGGQRVSKDALRVEAIGAVDELNAWLGMAAAVSEFDDLTTLVVSQQSRLFEVGADLATPREREQGKANEPRAVPRLTQAQIDEVEQHIDRIDEHLPAMRHFVLPGGGELSARLHAARTVCRRAERVCVALSRVEPVGDEIGVYLNRLSDLLFVLARRANQLAGVHDVPWQSPARE